MIPAPQTVRFAVFEADLKTGELRKNGIKIKLQEKPFQILSLLVEHRGELVTREELREKLWSADTFVDFDHSLGTAIAKLRQALGDSAQNPRFVETVSNRGYRFLVPVETVLPRRDESFPRVSLLRRISASAGAGLLLGVLLIGAFLRFNIRGAADWLRRQSNPPIQSLVVLPLENLSGDPAEDYFADGMTDALITDLSRIGALRVISRTSSMHYKGARKSLPQIARELNVDGVVEGTVTRSGNRVRITAQLLHAGTDQHLWAETYERDLSDVLKLQGEMARTIAQQVRIRLTPQQQSQLSTAAVNPQAYEVYLRGRYFWNQRTEAGLWKSVEMFQNAISLDPNSALPYAGVADAYLVLGSWAFEAVPPSEMIPKTLAAAQRAVQLDPALAEAHTVLAGFKHGFEWDFQGAELEYQRAIELNPSYAHAHQWYGQLLCELGRFDECRTEAYRAHFFDPLNLVMPKDAWSYWQRRYKDAIASIQETLELDPNFRLAHRELGQIYEQQEMYEAAIQELQRAVELSGSHPLDLSALGHAYAVSGQHDKARHAVQKLQDLSSKRYVSGFDFALVYAGLGEKDRAMSWLDKAFQERSTWMLHLKVDPRLDPLRSDPRFQDLLRRVGLSP